MTISETFMDELCFAPHDVLPVLEMRTLLLNESVNKHSKDCLCDGELLKDLMRIAEKINYLTEGLYDADDYQLSFREYLFFNDCAKYLEAIKNVVPTIPDLGGFKRGVFHLAEQYDYEQLLFKLKDRSNTKNTTPSFVETCDSITSFYENRQKAISYVQTTIELVCEQLINQIYFVISQHLSYDNVIAAIENGARCYFTHNIDRETDKLKKQARKLIKPWQTKLTIDHWCEMKTTEEKAMSFAVNGNLVDARDDESLNGYKVDERCEMEEYAPMIEIVAENFSDDQLFDMSSVVDDLFRYNVALNYKNIDLFFRMVLRGNIIRCNLYPGLKPQFDAWLSGEIITESEEKSEPTAKKIIAGPLETRKAMRLWKKLQDAGEVDENCMPKVSDPKAAIIASVMSDILELKPRWGAFEIKWDIDNLANKLVRAQSTRYYDSYLRKIENLLE